MKLSVKELKSNKDPGSQLCRGSNTKSVNLPCHGSWWFFLLLVEFFGSIIKMGSFCHSRKSTNCSL
jgi:hypothetical protein